jgi:hypothetical protein
LVVKAALPLLVDLEVVDVLEVVDADRIAGRVVATIVLKLKKPVISLRKSFSSIAPLKW